MQRILITRGDTYNFTIRIRDDQGEYRNCSDWEIWFTVRRTIAKTDVVSDEDALISKQIEGSASGIMTLNLSSSDTDIDVGVFKYDIQVKNSNGIHSSGVGEFEVSADVTRDR